MLVIFSEIRFSAILISDVGTTTFIDLLDLCFLDYQISRFLDVKIPRLLDFYMYHRI